mmetsp:Transcript_6555/g.22597  ORF Transcript_6555/g.22597 Transcript_6555/m.22597 type:complete len:207 (-) Transcript_6555:125-745(-)
MHRVLRPLALVRLPGEDLDAALHWDLQLAPPRPLVVLPLAVVPLPVWVKADAAAVSLVVFPVSVIPQLACEDHGPLAVPLVESPGPIIVVSRGAEVLALAVPQVVHDLALIRVPVLVGQLPLARLYRRRPERRFLPLAGTDDLVTVPLRVLSQLDLVPYLLDVPSEVFRRQRPVGVGPLRPRHEVRPYHHAQPAPLSPVVLLCLPY